tara:strand:- start:43 stop:462 length:420 start_codon:yes stop_codon:yes gene_type:complete
MPFYLKPGKHNQQKPQSIMDPNYTEEKPEWSADKVIELNNLASKAESTAALPGGKFAAKSLIKEGLKKYVGPIAGRIFGIGSMMLTSQSAYARPPGEDVDGEYIQYDDFENPKWSQTNYAKRYQNLNLSPPSTTTNNEE